MKLIFDFDGTLVDSAPDIGNCLKEALADNGLFVELPAARNLIGPPLPDLIATACPETEEPVRTRIAARFRDLYDNSNFSETAFYPGIRKLLDDCRKSGFQLYLATNKRIAPTRRILEYLDCPLFENDHLFCVDYPGKSSTKKSSMLRTIRNNPDSTVRCLYIGDTESDRFAANEADVDFFGVSWGYGFTPEEKTGSFSLFHSVEELYHGILTYSSSAETDGRFGELETP